MAKKAHKIVGVNVIGVDPFDGTVTTDVILQSAQGKLKDVRMTFDQIDQRRLASIFHDALSQVQACHDRTLSRLRGGA